MRRRKEGETKYSHSLLALLTRQPWPTPRHSHLFPVKQISGLKSRNQKQYKPSHSKKEKITNRTYHWSSGKITSKLKPIYLYVPRIYLYIHNQYPITNGLSKKNDYNDNNIFISRTPTNDNNNYDKFA